MTPVTTKQWTDALRSGDYEQGTGGLCKSVPGSNLYCCVGVMATIAGATKTSIKNFEGYSAFVFEWDGQHEKNEATIPPSLQSIILTDLDLSQINPVVNHNEDGMMNQTIISTLVVMNDEDGASFSEIADKIDELWAVQNKEKVVDE